jgi:2-keto-4-pentenoate hydratase/2-oxohepta-3-ene-1,7-dioic acid hydratase in catechol pathway
VKLCRFVPRGDGGPHRAPADGRIRFGPSWGALAGDRVQPIGDPFEPLDVAPAGDGLPLDDVRLLAPCRPGKIVAIGLNYREHAREMGKALPAEPLLFLKPASAVVGPGAAIELPAESQQVDHEGELAVVIGRRARRVAVDEARAYILGCTCLNDVTARDLQRKDVQYTRAKGFDTFAPLGPVIATDVDPDDVWVEVRVNGQVRQRGHTGDMVFPVAELVARVSAVMTLEPGDVISTGTPPGVGPLRPGDTVDVTISGIGTLSNPVVARPATT